GIPGTLGGALFMNAGAYKSNMAEIVKEVYVLINQEVKTLSIDSLEYGYRSSIFQKNRDWIILGAKIQLTKGNQKDIRSLMDSRRERRMSSQPLSMPNAGSVFRNPEGHAAWQLIEEAGLRGLTIGGAQVSDKHANFIVNADNASAKDVAELMGIIQKTVKERFQVELKSEVEKFNWKQ
ncbi:MAG: UDP-N-acetylmuramate dehydrogenase, partial [Longicatena sp.]|nr:UDP-N-acetylmuramate dehydrogenase [Longicatena sp.]